MHVCVGVCLWERTVARVLYFHFSVALNSLSWRKFAEICLHTPVKPLHRCHLFARLNRAPSGPVGQGSPVPLAPPEFT